MIQAGKAASGAGPRGRVSMAGTTGIAADPPEKGHDGLR